MQSKEELEVKIQEVSSLKGEKAEAVHQRGQLQKQVTSLQKEMSDATQLHGTTAHKLQDKVDKQQKEVDKLEGELLQVPL